MRRLVQSDKIGALKLAYFEQLKLGVRGNTATVEVDMKRAGIVHPVGTAMLWEQEIVKRAAGIPPEQFDLTPVLGLRMGAWEQALDDIIAELRNAVGTTEATAETDGTGSTGGTPSPLSSVSSLEEVG